MTERLSLRLEYEHFFNAGKESRDGQTFVMPDVDYDTVTVGLKMILSQALIRKSSNGSLNSSVKRGTSDRLTSVRRFFIRQILPSSKF